MSLYKTFRQFLLLIFIHCGILPDLVFVFQVKKLQNLAYQLGQEESKEMTRGKYLNILRRKN